MRRYIIRIPTDTDDITRTSRKWPGWSLLTVQYTLIVSIVADRSTYAAGVCQFSLVDKCMVPKRNASLEFMAMCTWATCDFWYQTLTPNNVNYYSGECDDDAAAHLNVLLLTIMTHHILCLYLRSAGSKGNRWRRILCADAWQMVRELEHPNRCEPWNWLSGANAVCWCGRCRRPVLLCL